MLLITIIGFCFITLFYNKNILKEIIYKYETITYLIYNRGEIIKMITNKGKFKLLMPIVIVSLLFSSISNASFIKVNNNQSSEAPEDTEYWALLVAVGVYYNHPDQDRPSMLDAVDNLYSSLLESPNWQADHIHVLKAEQATTFNLIKELIWLILSEGKDDYSLVYITTHGGPLTRNGLPWDLPPKDEADGCDEVLAMYYGFERFDHITDDMLNFFFKFIQSKGLCVIIDSCYSGGFNDPAKINNLLKFNKQELGKNIITKNFEPEKFTQGMVEELTAQGRVVLMSSQENEVSYGSYFSETLISGFNGWADFTGNLDGINSAEEAFDFAYPLVVFFTGGDQHPTISDQFPGEFPVTFS